jgi:hypothetical protein
MKDTRRIKIERREGEKGNRKVMKGRKSDGQHNLFHTVLILPISVSLLISKYLSLSFLLRLGILDEVCFTILALTPEQVLCQLLKERD